MMDTDHDAWKCHHGHCFSWKQGIPPHSLVAPSPPLPSARTLFLLPASDPSMAEYVHFLPLFYLPLSYYDYDSHFRSLAPSPLLFFVISSSFFLRPFEKRIHNHPSPSGYIRETHPPRRQPKEMRTRWAGEGRQC